MAQLLMPKATAVWLVQNTTLTFEQIAEFCGLHSLEVQGIADGEVAIGIVGLDPTVNGQLTKEEIMRCEADSTARLKMQIDSKPEELDSLDREIVRLKIEQEALKKESDRGSKSRLQSLEKELAELGEKSAALTARWTAEKARLSSAAKCCCRFPTRRDGR